MRRRQRALPPGVDGVPAALAWFSDDDGWPGRTAYQRFMAWSDARYEWAEANLPGGWDELQKHFPMGDAPWDPYGEDGL